MDVTQEYSEW